MLVLSILMFYFFQVYLVPAAGTINNRSIIPQLEDCLIERTFGVPIKEAACTKPPDTTGISRSALISMAALTINCHMACRTTGVHISRCFIYIVKALLSLLVGYTNFAQSFTSLLQIDGCAQLILGFELAVSVSESVMLPAFNVTCNTTRLGCFLVSFSNLVVSRAFGWKFECFLICSAQRFCQLILCKHRLE